MRADEFVPPVQLHLAEQYAAALEVLRQGVPRVRQWAALPAIERAALAAALTGALQNLLSAAENMRQLPASTACVCPACGVVALPGWDGAVHSCPCGRVWMVQGRAGHLLLPDGFWATAMPGDAYEKAIMAAWAELDDEEEAA